MAKVIRYTTEHVIPDNEWRGLRAAYKKGDRDAIAFFAAGHEIDWYALIDALQAECQPRKIA
jgi:hypothetical protein